MMKLSIIRGRISSSPIHRQLNRHRATVLESRSLYCPSSSPPPPQQQLSPPPPTTTKPRTIAPATKQHFLLPPPPNTKSSPSSTLIYSYITTPSPRSSYYNYYYSTSTIAFNSNFPSSSPPSPLSSSTNTYYHDDDDSNNDEENRSLSSLASSDDDEEQEMVKAQLFGLTGSNVAHTRLQNELQQSFDRLAQLQAKHSGDTDDTNTNDDDGDDDEAVDMHINMVIVNAMRDVAEVQWKLGMLEDAQSMQEKVLSCIISIYSSTSISTSKPPDHEEIARTMHVIGSIQLRLQNYAESQKWLESALEMMRRLYCSGPGNGTILATADDDDGSAGLYHHYEIGKTLNALALLHIHFMSSSSQNDDIDAIDDETINIALSLMDEADSQYRYHSTTGPVAHDNDDTEDDDKHDNVNNDNDADAGDETSTTMADDPGLGSISENMAMLYRKRHDFSKALEKYEDALRIRQKVVANVGVGATGGSENESKIVSLYMDIGDCLGGGEEGLQRYGDALQSYELALDMHAFLVKRELVFDNDNRTDDDDDNDNAAVMEGNPAATTSEIVLNNITTTELTAEVGTSVEGVLRHNIGTMHAQMGAYEKSLKEYHIALLIKKNLVGEDHPEVAITLNAIGALMASDGEEAHKALAYFREALRIYRLHSFSTTNNGNVWSLGNGDEADEHVAKTIKNIQLVERNLSMGNRMGNAFGGQ